MAAVIIVVNAGDVVKEGDDRRWWWSDDSDPREAAADKAAVLTIDVMGVASAPMTCAPRVAGSVTRWSCPGEAAVASSRAALCSPSGDSGDSPSPSHFLLEAPEKKQKQNKIPTGKFQLF